MPPITLRLQDQTIKLVQSIETANTEKTLDQLIYTPGLASAVLYAHGIEAGEIRSVTPDRQGTDVRIVYTDDNQETQRLTVHCREFLTPFRLRRTTKSTAYKLAPLDPQQATQIPAIAAWLPLAPGATLTAVYQNGDKPAQLVVCEPTADGQTRQRCTCPDAQGQLTTLPQHPALWDAMGQQPVCKHWLRVQRQ